MGGRRIVACQVGGTWVPVRAHNIPRRTLMAPRRRWLLACLVVLAVLAPACAPPAAPAPVKIKIVNQPFISFAPFHIALAEGYFAEQGLDAELVTFTTTPEVLPALLSGEVDVA